MRRGDVGTSPPKRLSKPAAAIPFVIAASALLLYVRTLYPDVAGGDSGELVGAVFTHGVIHPPGYPLYSLLGSLFVHLPLGTVAWRVNLLSAVCDAGAATLLYLAVARWTRSVWAGVAAAGLFATAPGIWRYAVCAEVFALNNLVNALLLFLAVLWTEQEPRAGRRYALLGAFVFGLGLSNHHTILFTAAPLVLWAAWRGHREGMRSRDFARLTLPFALGLVPYVWLPLASAGTSTISWGVTGTWSGFWAHVLRREYGTFQLAPAGVAAGTMAGVTAMAWARDLIDQVGFWGLPLAVLGVIGCARERRRRSFGFVLLVAPLVAVGVIALLGNLPTSDLLHRGIVARFWQEPDIFVFVWCGLGVAELERRLPPAVTAAATAAVALGAVLLPLALGFGAMDRHGSTLVRSYGSEILRAAPKGALLFTKGDLITNTLRYLQAAEGMRPDVRVVDMELLGFAWSRPRIAAEHPEIVIPGARYAPGAPDGFTVKQLFDANIARSPVLVCGGVKAFDTSADASYGRWPWGLCELVHPGAEPMNVVEWISSSEAALPHIDFTHQAHPEGSWEGIVWSDYWEVRQARAVQLLAVAGADPARQPYIAAAARILQGIVDENPASSPHVYKNLAIALGRTGLDTAEQRARAAGAWRKYMEVAPKDDPQLPAIEKEIRRLLPQP